MSTHSIHVYFHREIGTMIIFLVAKSPFSGAMLSINELMFISAGQSGPQSSPRTLSTGEKQEHPSHVPDYLPSFPDPHTYIRSEVTFTRPAALSRC